METMQGCLSSRLWCVQRSAPLRSPPQSTANLPGYLQIVPRNFSNIYQLPKRCDYITEPRRIPRVFLGEGLTNCTQEPKSQDQCYLESISWDLQNNNKSGQESSQRMSTGLCLSGKMCDGCSPARAATHIILGLWSYRWVHCHCRDCELPRMGDEMENGRDRFSNPCEEGLNPRLELRSPTQKVF